MLVDDVSLDNDAPGVSDLTKEEKCKSKFKNQPSWVIIVMK